MCFLQKKTITVWSKGARLSPARSHSVVCIVPFLSPFLVLCSLCCLSCSSPPSLFSVTPLLFSPSLFVIVDPSDPSLLKMCLFPLFCLQKMWACVRRGPASGPCLWFTERWGWSKRQRFEEATSGDVAACISLSLGHTGFTQPSSISLSLGGGGSSSIFNWETVSSYLFFEALSLVSKGIRVDRKSNKIDQMILQKHC